MNFEEKNIRRKLLRPEAISQSVSWEWDSENYIRAKSTRVIALSGQENINIHNLEIRKPIAIIEIIGSRIATLSTAMLVIFSAEEQYEKSTFRLDTDVALGTLYFPPAMFAGILQLTFAPSVYFRMGKDGFGNCISNDCNFIKIPSF